MYTQEENELQSVILYIYSWLYFFEKGTVLAYTILNMTQELKQISSYV